MSCPYENAFSIVVIPLKCILKHYFCVMKTIEFQGLY